MLTAWNKALDFSGGSEYAVTANAAQSNNPTRQAPAVTRPLPTDGYTVTNGRPWACTLVFKTDGNASNQHIWNQGEGAANSDDNIALRVDASGNLWFSWGRSGEMNECKIGTGFRDSSGTTPWWGVYVGYQALASATTLPRLTPPRCSTSES